MTEKNDKRSLVMLTLSMAIFGSIGVFRRYIPLSSAALACFRGAAGAAFLFAVAKIRKKRISHGIGIRKILLLAFTGAVMGLNWILLFEAYHYTTVSTATLCYYMQPTIVVLLSPLLFRERITLKKGICAALSLAGMVLVSGIVTGGFPSASELKGILLGLGAAALYATVVIMNKKLAGIDAYEKTIIQLLSAGAALVPYVLAGGQVISGEWTPAVIAMLAVIGVVHTGVAYALYFGSMDGLRAQTVAIFSYLDPIVALVLSAVVLGERMTVYGAVGAVLIIGAAVAGETGRDCTVSE